MTGPNGPVCACCRHACEDYDAEGRCDECHAEAEAAEAIDADFDAADEPLFVGALTEADLERFAAAEAPAYAVAS